MLYLSFIIWLRAQLIYAIMLLCFACFFEEPFIFFIIEVFALLASLGVLILFAVSLSLAYNRVTRKKSVMLFCSVAIVLSCFISGVILSIVLANGFGLIIGLCAIFTAGAALASLIAVLASHKLIERRMVSLPVQDFSFEANS